VAERAGVCVVDGEVVYSPEQPESMRSEDKDEI
jgi:hypothetical protein